MKRFWGILFALVLVFSLVGLMTSASVVQAQTTFTVNTTDDIDDGKCDATHCSLREAINAANASPGTDTITFNIPSMGPHTIQPLSGLPTITDPVIIDGYTQPGASPNTNPAGTGLNTLLMIELDGSNAGFGAEGLRITAGSSTVRGLVINRFSGNGIGLETNGQNVIEGNFIGTDVTGTNVFPNRNLYGLYISGSSTNNTIGGTTVAAGNVISGNDASSVRLSTQNVVQGNFIGTDVTGTTDLGNAMGVSVGGSTNTIGGTTVAAGNIISGNAWVGIDMTAGPTGNLVQGNFIGTDVTGTTALGNGSSGVRISNASGNTIGGTIAGAGNVISGNNGSGVEITGGATSNLMQGNFIGTDVTRTTALGNSGPGVSIRGSNNMVGGTANGAGNTIAFNGGEGVYIIPFFGLPSTGNAILSNSIHSNASLGIDLGADGVTPNDPGDGDTGANNLQNFPILTSATSGSTTIEGTLNSTPNTEFRLEFFANSSCDPSGYGEGENFLGSTDVTTDGSGNVSFVPTFSGTVPSGQFVTVTATDPDGNTSEFSQCMEVIAGNGGVPNGNGGNGGITVGGAVAQVDKFGLMMPWIIASALVLLAITSLALWMRKNKT